VNTREAAVALAHRGIKVRVRDLGKRKHGELADVIAWAHMGERIETAPAWLRDYLALGMAGPIGGVCLACGCTDERGCPDGCHWIDESHTRCSECREAGSLEPFDNRIQKARGGARS
jgi:hypothetical protein